MNHAAHLLCDPWQITASLGFRLVLYKNNSPCLDVGTGEGPVLGCSLKSTRAVC